MRCLSDVPSDRLMVECTGCRRRGSYALGRLMAQHGGRCELRNFLAMMRARCGQAPCHAHLVVPLCLDLDRTAYPGNTFVVDVWTNETTREMEVGAIQNFDVAAAAFDRAVALWPHSTITIRLRAQIMRAHCPEEDRARELQARIFRRLGLR